MDVKITVKDKPAKAPVYPATLARGTVFINIDDVTILKLCDANLLLLRFTSGNTWLEMSTGSYDDMPVKEILGKISEIIVKPL